MNYLPIIYGIVSLLIVGFLIIPFLDSFAYKRKNLVLHIILAIALVFIHNRVGFVWLSENVIYILILWVWHKGSLKALEQKNPEMDDVFGRQVVLNASRALIIVYVIGYSLLSVEII